MYIYNACDLYCSTDGSLEELIQDLSVDIVLYNNHMDAVRSIIVSLCTKHRMTHDGMPKQSCLMMHSCLILTATQAHLHQQQ